MSNWFIVKQLWEQQIAILETKHYTLVQKYTVITMHVGAVHSSVQEE
jgi:hypothetical protein